MRGGNNLRPVFVSRHAVFGSGVASAATLPAVGLEWLRQVAPEVPCVEALLQVRAALWLFHPASFASESRPVSPIGIIRHDAASPIRDR